MKVPQINWIPFDKNNPPLELDVNHIGETYLILLRKDYYNNGTWEYFVDAATPWGDYLDNFWDTPNDWVEGEAKIEVVAYAEFPYSIKESDLVEN